VELIELEQIAKRSECLRGEHDVFAAGPPIALQQKEHRATRSRRAELADDLTGPDPPEGTDGKLEGLKCSHMAPAASPLTDEPTLRCRRAGASAPESRSAP